MYIVLLEWYDEELDNLDQESRQYFFNSADTALSFVKMITRVQKHWVKVRLSQECLSLRSRLPSWYSIS